MIPITDLLGNTEPLTNLRGFTRKRKVNGEKMIESFVIHDETNNLSYGMVDGESIIKFDNEDYVIKHLEHTGKGKKTLKKFDGVHRFFNDMINSFQYKNRNGSLTFDAACQYVFEDTSYNFIIIGTFPAQRFENFGRENRLSLFKKILERYEVEFYLEGNTVFLKAEIGVKTDFQYRYGHNIKSIAKQVNTHNLATVIKGYGGTPDDDGNYPVEVEYRSPNFAILGELHADAVYDERFTSEASMLAHLKKVLIDEPQVSLTVDLAELQAAGYNYNMANEGDYGFIIYEPMDDLAIEARIVEIIEVYDAELKPIQTFVTLSNVREKITDKMIRLSQTSKTLERLMNGHERLPYNTLDEAVRRATESLQSAQTELDFENGIIARSKINPDHLVLFNSAGIGVSIDGGYTFRTAMTAEGIVADLITAGTMLADRIQGGLFTLGGLENGNGRMQVLNADGEVIADLDAEQGGFADLYVGNLTSPTVPNYNNSNITYFVSLQSGSDENDGLSETSSFYSIQRAIDMIPKVNDGNITILIYGIGANTFVEQVEIHGFVGRGSITIDFRLSSRLFNGQFDIRGNTNHIEIDGKFSKFSGRNQNQIINIERSIYVTVRQCRFYGNNSTERGLRLADNSSALVRDNHFYDFTDGVLLETLSRMNGNNNQGTVSRYGYSANGTSQIGHFSGRPRGGVADIYTSSTSSSVGASDSNTPPPVPDPPPTPATTTRWNSNNADNWANNGWGWLNDGYPIQGQWQSFGRRSGCWFFGETVRNALNGRAISQMRIRVKRHNGGGLSGAQTITIRYHNYASKPGGQPSLSSETVTVSLAWGQEKWVTLPASFRNAFQNGSARGLGIHIVGNTPYARLDASATIEATYQ